MQRPVLVASLHGSTDRLTCACSCACMHPPTERSIECSYIYQPPSSPDPYLTHTRSRIHVQPLVVLSPSTNNATTPSFFAATNRRTSSSNNLSISSSAHSPLHHHTMMDVSSSGSSLVLVPPGGPIPSPLSRLSSRLRGRRQQEQGEDTDWERVEEEDGENDEEESEDEEAPTPKVGSTGTMLRPPPPSSSQQQQQHALPGYSRRRGGSGLVHELGGGPRGGFGGLSLSEAEGEEADDKRGERRHLPGEKEEGEEEEEELITHANGSYVFRRKAGTISVSGFEAAIGEGGILSEVGRGVCIYE